MPKINSANILDQFEEFVPNAAAHDEAYLKAVVQGVREHSMPVEPDMDRFPISGGLRPVYLRCLVLTPTERRLKAYQTLHYAEPLGINLKVGFYLVGGVKAQGVGGWAILGGASQGDVDNVQSLVRLIHQFAVVPAMHEVAGLAGGASDRPKQGFFGQ